MSNEIERNDESGQTMAEYTVVLGVIALVTVATFTLLGDAVQGALEATVELLRRAVS
jgi:Flp pilus assembly pilin Flp